MSLLSIVASSSAFFLPASPPPKGSSIDSDWSTKNKKQPGFLRLISAWYAMVFLHFVWHHENYDSHMPEVTGWSPVATIPRMQRPPECSDARVRCVTLVTGERATGRTRVPLPRRRAAAFKAKDFSLDSSGGPTRPTE